MNIGKKVPRDREEAPKAHILATGTSGQVLGRDFASGRAGGARACPRSEELALQRGRARWQLVGCVFFLAVLHELRRDSELVGRADGCRFPLPPPCSGPWRPGGSS